MYLCPIYIFFLKYFSSKHIKQLIPPNTFFGYDFNHHGIMTSYNYIREFTSIIE